MQNSIKNGIIKFQKYMKPSGSCQACQSEVQLQKDCIITCQICRSCIHQTHYGSQLLQPPEVWQCQRCRYFLQNGPSDIFCQFCPNLRGIMKQYTFQNRKLWLHPQCAAWGYPTIYFATNKKQVIKKQKAKHQSTYFWVSDYESNPNPCQVCKATTGYRIKCKYYSCKKSYHVTCATTQGIVRDLQSMRIQNGAYFPVYCKQHIQLKIEDCKKRFKIYKDKGDIQKATHYHKIGNLLTNQLKNLQAAVKKCKFEEQMIKKMSLQTRRNIQTHDNTSFSDLQQSFESQQQKQFLKILQQEMIDQSLPLKPFDDIKINPVYTVEAAAPKNPISHNNMLKTHMGNPEDKQIHVKKNNPGRPPHKIHRQHSSNILHRQKLKSTAQQINSDIRKSQMDEQKQLKPNSYQQMFQNF